MKAMTKSMNFINAEFNDIKKENEDLKNRVIAMEKKIDEFENNNKSQEKVSDRIEEINLAVHEKEQYDRNRNIEINELDRLPNEKLPEVVRKLANAFGITFYRPEMIDAAHRIPNKNKNKPDCLISLYNSNFEIAVMRGSAKGNTLLQMTV